jgi:hypothetical protein
LLLSPYLTQLRANFDSGDGEYRRLIHNLAFGTNIKPFSARSLIPTQPLINLSGVELMNGAIRVSLFGADNCFKLLLKEQLSSFFYFQASSL